MFPFILMNQKRNTDLPSNIKVMGSYVIRIIIWGKDHSSVYVNRYSETMVKQYNRWLSWYGKKHGEYELVQVTHLYTIHYYKLRYKKH